MSETQLTFVLSSMPTMITVLIGILVNNSRLSDVRADLNNLRADMNRQFSDTRDLWRAELHRVEEILDARLKHLEER